MEPFKGINPDECVAMGAAIQGGVMIGNVKDLVLLDVTPLSLGIETVGDVYARIISRNSSIPIEKSQIFTTAAPFQSAVEVNVLQGEREVASLNKSLGKFKLTGIRRAPAGVPQIEVKFRIDANGIVNVSAKDLGTGKQQEIVITGSSNMSERDIERAVRDAELYAEEDKRRREAATLLNDAEQLVYRAENAMHKMSREEKAAVQEPLKRVKKAIADKEHRDLSSAYDDLTSALNHTQAAQYASQEDTDESDGSYDADFEKKDN